ncbi:MAG: CfrBI family restriction endonuclease [Chloroflexi bacterium]|nr:CfrBI family restriction endonuclease [Chloroflexota bacterium]
MVKSFLDLLDDDAISLLDANGKEVIQKLGINTARDIVLDVMLGKNLRDSTELLTRRRLAALNIAGVAMILKGIKRDRNFVEKMPEIAEKILKRKRISKGEKWIALWVLGLTGKASQNVLRDKASMLTEYRTRYVEINEDTVNKAIIDFGRLEGEIYLDQKLITELNWQFMLQLMGMIGSQTLTIRGSEKSLYGKLFEKLVLGSLLHILGFAYAKSGEPTSLKKEFWLSSTGERESDATALWGAGKGARFDIGFIGRGNTEISLDKVSRFAREVELGQKKWYMATIIIVDRIGERSKIRELAQNIDGDIVQMSMTYWPQDIAKILRIRLQFEHPLIEMPHSEVSAYLSDAMKTVPIEKFLLSE